MGAGWYVVRAEARARRQSLLGLVLLVGLAGGLVLASAAGARRTETAYDRFLEAANASHVLISSESGSADYEPLRAVEGVEGVAPIAGIELFPEAAGDVDDVLNLGSLDGTFGWSIDRPNVLEGRLPDPGSDDEVFVNERYAETFDLRAGDRIELGIELLGAEEDPEVISVTVAGIGAFTTDVVPTTELDELPTALIGPALTERALASGATAGFDGAALVLADPSDGAVVEAALAALDEEAFVLEQSSTHATVETAIRPQATAMWAFAAVVAVAALLVVAQAVARHAAQAAAGTAALDALGVRRRERVLQVTGVHVLVGVGACALAVAIAVAASPLFPIGRAGAAEPNPGVAANLAVLAAGCAVLLMAVLGAAASGAWVATRAARSDRPQRQSALARAAASAGAPPRMVLGVRRAFEPGAGSASVPVRSGLVGAALAVAAVVTTATFASSLDALVTEPQRYGQNWAVAFDAQFGPVPAGELLERYGDDPRVSGMAGIEYAELDVDDEAVPVVAFDRLSGKIAPTVLEGRAPGAPGEIALGVTSLAAVGADIGDEVTVDAGAGPEAWTVVGSAVFPQLSLGSFQAMGLGVGGVVDGAAVQPAWDAEMIEVGIAEGELPQEVSPADFVADGRVYNAVLVAAPEEHAPAIARELEEHVLASSWGGYAGVRLDQRPAAISTYAEVRSTPVVLTVLLALLGAGLVSHVLLTAVRRRRRELAICTALGMRRRDLATIVRWQATTVAVLATVLGVPLGLAAGRLAWRLFAEDLGVPATSPTAWAWLAVAIAGTLLVANVAAALPGWRARRLQPVEILRAE